jgi:hypothetical protein
MSKLAEYRALELQLAEDLARLESLKGDEKLKVEIEFEGKLKALMSKYEKSLRDVIMILDPHVSRSAPVASDKEPRKPRELKIYEHPDTKERVETKGGNHKILKTWKAEFGDEMVESWRIQ